MSSLDFETIQALLTKPEPKPKPVSTRQPVQRHEGPLDVLIQSGYCVMCARHESRPKVKTMYSVNGDALCAPHAMYTLSKICLDNGYKVKVECKSDESSSVSNNAA